ncbi:hypothetical protein QJQ45_010965 [Haematococcus lacustris]|nr:hypothetical protein QJQ45_010965 [Haematococcus lacustris]
MGLEPFSASPIGWHCPAAHTGSARKRGSAAGPHDKHTERIGQEVMEVFGRCGSADQQAQLLDRVLTSPQLQVAVQQAMQQCPTTKQRVACLLLDRVQLLMDSGTCGKRGGQHTDDVTARRVLARLVPPELLEQQLVSAFAQQTGLDRHWVSEAAQQNLEQRACIQGRAGQSPAFRRCLGKDVVALHSMMQQTEEALRHAILEECVPRGELQQLEERLDEKLAIKEEVILRFAPAGSDGWVEIHVEGEAASYRSGQSLLAIGKFTAQMAEVIAACNNLVPPQVPLAHRSCARAAAAALAVGKRLRGKEPASQLQPMARLCSTPTQAPAQPGPAHAPCPHHLPVQPPSHPSQSQLQGSSQHHPALPALLHLPGLSILTRPATNPLTSPAEEHQPMIHTTVEQDEQTMPPSMPKQQQD